MRWFAATYRFVGDLRQKARAVVAPIMARIRAAISDGSSSRLLQLIQRFRRRVRQVR
jgi:hypothetical protein